MSMWTSIDNLFRRKSNEPVEEDEGQRRKRSFNEPFPTEMPKTFLYLTENLHLFSYCTCFLWTFRGRNTRRTSLLGTKEMVRQFC